jgi:hypothetical protein
LTSAIAAKTPEETGLTVKRGADAGSAAESHAARRSAVTPGL